MTSRLKGQEKAFPYPFKVVRIRQPSFCKSNSTGQENQMCLFSLETRENLLLAH